MARKKTPKQKPQAPKPRPVPKEKPMHLTLGSDVWYHPDHRDHRVYSCGDKPMAAKVVAAHDENCFNLIIFTPDGQTRFREHVRFVAAGDACPDGECHCTMPGTLYDLVEPAPDTDLAEEEPAF
jgi:hypothetical protein